jgi:hypothetical protein
MTVRCLTRVREVGISIWREPPIQSAEGNTRVFPAASLQNTLSSYHIPSGGNHSLYCNYDKQVFSAMLVADHFLLRFGLYGI